MTDIVFVVAVGENGEMGRDNQLLWYLPGDLPRFKRITMGKPVVMGRKTWESIGRALPGRQNLVVTRNDAYRAEGYYFVDHTSALMAIGPDGALRLIWAPDATSDEIAADLRALIG